MYTYCIKIYGAKKTIPLGKAMTILHFNTKLIPIVAAK